jgi:hypothetical protein
LPQRLGLLADRVLADVNRYERIGNDWGLHPADELEIRTPQSLGAEYLRQMKLRCSSGWASLAGGLIARAEGLLPRNNVWASGAWDERGLADVRGLSPKLELAASWWEASAEKRPEPIKFFVPRWRAGKAEAWVQEKAPDRVVIGILEAPSRPEPRKALNAFLAALTSCPPVPDPGSPDEEAQFKTCRKWLIHQTASVDLESPERRFYRSHLLPGIIRRMNEQVHETAPQGFKATHFATIVSKNHELAMFTPLALGVTHCLLLHTPDGDMPSRAQRCAEYLQPRGVTCMIRPFEKGAEMVSRIGAEICAFTRDVPPERVVIDLKPGTKKMTYAQSRAAQAGNWLFNLEGGFLDDGRSDPGTERPELWRAGE